MYLTSTPSRRQGRAAFSRSPRLKSITGNAGLANGSVQVVPTSGGDVELPALTQV